MDYMNPGSADCPLPVDGGRGKGANLSGNQLRIATKYVNATRSYFAGKGQQVEVIKLYGSMELAPLVGLSDLIVDLVEY